MCVDISLMIRETFRPDKYLVSTGKELRPAVLGGDRAL